MRSPKTHRSSVLAAALIAGLLLPVQALAQPSAADSPKLPNYAAQAFDAVVLRPLEFAGVIAGAALFVPAAIVTAPGGRDSIEEAWDVFLAPAKTIFKRPLGEF